jgi:hypothetical protein
MEADAATQHDTESFSVETRSAEMTTMLPRALKVEGYALSDASAAINEGFPHAEQNPAFVPSSFRGGAQYIVEWLAISVLLGLAGLGTFASVTVEASSLL